MISWKSAFIRRLTSAFAVLVVSLFALQGCALGVSAVSHAGGSRDDTVDASIDEGTLTAPIQNLFVKSRYLVVLASETTGVKAADFLSSNGGYRVAVDRAPGRIGEMTAAERGQSLRDMCKRPQSDASMILRTQAMDANTGFMAGIDGRQKIKRRWYLDVQDCKTSTQHIVSGVVEWDTSVYKQPDDLAIATTVANALIGKLIESVGRKAAPLAQAAEAEPSIAVPSKKSATAFNKSNVVGVYENRSESSFVFTLKLDSSGKATYTEPNMNGGKAFVRTGKWTLNGDTLDVDLAKEGRYTFTVREKLSWDSFGCKGGSFGLESQSIPKKGVAASSSYHVWRVADRNKIERCHN